MVREFTLPGAGLHASKLRIHGFGACMIAGTPHPLEESFFWRFATVLRDQTGFQIDTRIVSLGGFPTYKAVPHVKRALINAPDYVIIQLGSTDLTVSLNQYLLRLLGRNPRMGAESISRTNSVVGPMAPFERPTSLDRISERFILQSIVRSSDAWKRRCVRILHQPSVERNR